MKDLPDLIMAMAFLSLRAKNRLRTFAALPRLLLIRSSPRQPNECVLVVGEARSGTSWLGELVARMLNARVLFEPTNSHYTPFRNLPDLLYADGEMTCPAIEKCCRAIFTGRLLPNHFIERDNKPGKYQTVVVKDLLIPAEYSVVFGYSKCPAAAGAARCTPTLYFANIK